MNTFHVIIPARFASTRLPGKPLAKIGALTMIERVYRQAEKSGARSVCVATDDQKIVDEVQRFGGQVILTSAAHVSGTDRVYEAAQKLGLADTDIVVNLQGDEPFVPAENITQVADLVASSNHPMSTLCYPIEAAEDIENPNVVKVVKSAAGHALYFSRATIPYTRNPEEGRPDFFRHIGIYGFNMAFLKQYAELSESSLEQAEKLEQLRVLENGFSIAIAVAQLEPPAGIDTPEDLVAANQLVEQLREE
ncbi:MAG: 3-deoxy-manno-octulosonate cytidylyltransferase [Gammaproteobacteria bacterium]|nr:3-deoxy-manno-octulosonate cytidylyltransferase [Gammaproteobacteria bacterium]